MQSAPAPGSPASCGRCAATAAAAASSNQPKPKATPKPTSAALARVQRLVGRLNAEPRVPTVTGGQARGQRQGQQQRRPRAEQQAHAGVSQTRQATATIDDCNQPAQHQHARVAKRQHRNHRWLKREIVRRELPIQAGLHRKCTAALLVHSPDEGDDNAAEHHWHRVPINGKTTRRKRSRAKATVPSRCRASRPK